MTVRCVRNTGASLGPPLRPAFHTAESIFHVTVDQDYRVFGLGLFGTTLLALVLDDTGKPNWLPVGLFDLTDCEIPHGWHFGVFNEVAASGSAPSDGWVALWGYPDLVHDRRHIDRLVERDPAAMEVFFREAERQPERE